MSLEKKMNGAAILVEALEREGVSVLFGYPGGASMPIHQELTRSKMRVILPRHEQGEVFMAEGYAKSSGRVGVCLATSGPGATNLATGIADAKMDSVPVVCITGQVPTRVLGTDAFQETPTVEIYRPITKHAYLVRRTEEIARTIKEAFHIAGTGRPGPVVVDVPKDLQQKEIAAEFPDGVNLRGYKPHLRASPGDLQKVAEAIREAKRPVIYAGGGIVASGAGPALRTFAEKTRIPVAMTLMGLGVVPGDHYLSLWMLGMHGTVYANYAINEADLLLAFGVRFDDRVTGKVEEFAKHGKIVHIDVDPSEINKNKRAHIPISSDVGYAIEELNRIVEPGDYAEWHRKIEKWREEEPLAYEDSETQILPQRVIEELYTLTRGEAIVATGVGQHQMWAAQYYKVKRPRQWLTSGGLGAMGFGLPAAIGAQAAFPDRTVVDIDGDGSFLMNVQELATAYCENLPVKVVILNNQHLGMVVQWEDRFYGGNRAHTYIGSPRDKGSYPDFVGIAKGFGVAGRKVAEKADLRDALREMLASKTPYVLDVLVPYQEHVLPMIPSGMTVKDIIKR